MNTVKLGEICDIASGGTPSRGNTDYWQNGSIPWIKISNIKGKYVSEADEFITEEGLSGSSAKLFSKGTILYTIFATLGEVGILSIDACTNQAIAGITIKDASLVHQDYLYYYLKSQKSYVNGVGRGVAQNNINMSILRNFNVPLPNYDEQKVIVNTLDKIETVIEARKQELQKFDNLIKARFVEMFGEPEYNTKEWPVYSLSLLCDVGSSKRIYQNELSSGGVPFWRVSDLVSKMDTGNADSGLYIPKEKFNDLRRSNLVPVAGDILVTSRGTLGRCYIVREKDQFYFQDGMISWLSHYSNRITPLYLQYLFSMPGFRKQIDSMQAGSTVAYLSIAMLKKLRVMVPNVETQSAFAAFVARIDKSKAAVQQALDKAQLLFDSLMQRYFSQ